MNEQEDEEEALAWRVEAEVRLCAREGGGLHVGPGTILAGGGGGVGWHGCAAGVARGGGGALGVMVRLRMQQGSSSSNSDRRKLEMLAGR